MNVADAIILIFFLVNGWIAYRRGFVLSFFKLLSFVISIFLSYNIYPVVSTFLRNNTPLFEKIKNQVTPTILIPEGVQTNTLEGQTNFINELGIPKLLKDALIENNNSEIYDILKVDGLKDYIAGYIANICINIISMIVVLLVVSIGLKIIIGILDIISKLPIINSVNHLFGLLFGFVSGLLQIWIFFTILFIFQANPSFEKIFVFLGESSIARYLYEYNLLLNWVVGLFL